MTDDELKTLFRPLVADLLARGVPEATVRAICARVARTAIGAITTAPTSAPQPRRVGQQFSSDAAERFATYFAADDDGSYPGSMHRQFGLGAQAFAERTGLRRQYQVGDDGRASWAWVRPEPS